MRAYGSRLCPSAARVTLAGLRGRPRDCARFYRTPGFGSNDMEHWKPKSSACCPPTHICHPSAEICSFYTHIPDMHLSARSREIIPSSRIEKNPMGTTYRRLLLLDTYNLLQCGSYCRRDLSLHEPAPRAHTGPLHAPPSARGACSGAHKLDGRYQVSRSR